jgi:hypothetical protein
MGFLNFKKKKVSPKKHDDIPVQVIPKGSSEKAPVSEINIQKNHGKKRSNKKAPAALSSRTPVPLFTDHAGSDDGRRLHYKSHLFELSQRLVDETPPERRQSLVTDTTGVTDERSRPPSPANNYSYDCTNLTMTPRAIMVMTQDDMDKKQSDTPTEPGGVLDFVMNFNVCSDNICAALQDNEIAFSQPQVNEVEFSQQPVLESDPVVAIPREISFLPLSLRDESLLSDAGRSKYSVLDDNENGKPSLMKRITGKIKGEDTDNAIMSRLKVFVDAPPQCGASPTDAASVDGSMLTTPSTKADSLSELFRLEEKLPLASVLRKIGRSGVSP